MFSRLSFSFTLFVLIFAAWGVAQDGADDVRLFQNFFRDATITSQPYGEGLVNYATSSASGSSFNTLRLGAQGGYGINPNLEVNAGLAFMNYSMEVGNESHSESGISDLYVGGRYLALNQDNLRISAGGFLTLPIGSDKIGQGMLNFGGFGALRYGLSNGMVITGTLGLDFYETTSYEYNFSTFELEEKTEYKNSLAIAGGLIYPPSDQLAFVGELMFQTDRDFGMISAGVDYKVQSNGRVRGGLGIGIDDGAPDLQIQGSYLLSF